MPLHDFKCTSCNYEFEYYQKLKELSDYVKCIKCGGTAKKVFKVPSKIDLFREGYYEELGDDVPYISSRRQLMEECKKRGLRSRYLDEGNRYVKEGREI